MSNKPETLHPELRRRWDFARERYAALYPSGPYVVMTQALRTNDEQDALYAQGRSKPGKVVTNARAGQSLHNYGLAFDVAFKDARGHIDWNDLKPFFAFAKIAKAFGLAWGGDWKRMKDYPHFEPPAFTWQMAKAGKKPNFPPLPQDPPKPARLFETEEGEVFDEDEMKPAPSFLAPGEPAAPLANAATDTGAPGIAALATAELQPGVIAPAPAPADPTSPTAQVIGGVVVEKGITASTTKLMTEVAGWIGALFLAAKENIASIGGVSPENQGKIINCLIVLAIIYSIARLWSQSRIRKDAAAKSEAVIK